MSAAADPVFARLAENLIRQRSLAEMRRNIAAHNLDPARLRSAFEALREDWQKSGRQAACELLEFVRLHLADLLPAPKLDSGEIADEASLADALMGEPNVLRARSLLLAHPNLITPELVSRVQAKILPEHGPAPMDRVGLVTYLVARMLGNSEALVRGTLIWSGVLQRAGRFDAARRHLRQASRLAAEARDDVNRFLAMSAEAGLCRRMGKLPEAIALFEDCRRTPGVDAMQIIATLQALSSSYRENGDTPKAIESLDQAISLAGNTYLDRKFDALNARAIILEDSGQLEMGAISYESAITVAEQMNDRGRQFVAMNNRAGSFLKREMNKQGLNAFQQILRIVENWGHPPMIASAHNNLGNALEDMGRYSEARAEFKKALSSKLETGDRQGQCICFVGMGNASRQLGDLEAAKAHYDMALVPALETNDAALIALVTLNKYRKARGDFDDPAQSIESLQWARELCRQQRCHRDESLLTQRLIEFYVELGNRSQALSECRQIFTSGTFDRDLEGMLSITVNYASLMASEPGGWQAAFDLLSERAREIDRRLEETLVDARRGNIIASAFTAYAGLIELLAAPEVGRAQTSPLPQELAFDLHESAKCRSFLSGTAAAPVHAPETIPQPLRAAEADLLQSVRALQEQGATTSEADRYERLRQAREALRDLWRQIKPLAPEYVRFRSGAPYTFGEMSSLLPAGECETAFVSFFVDDKRTRCFIFRRQSPAPRILTLELGRDELTRLAVLLRRTFNGAPEEFPPYPPIRGDKPHRRKLDFLQPLEIAMAELFDAIEGARLLVVAPHGPLHLIPLQILRCTDGRFAAQHFGIVYTPSLSAGLQFLHRGGEGASQKRKIPVFAAGVSSADDTRPQYFESDADIFDKDRWHLTSAFGVDHATRDAVLSGVAGKPVVHLSCHGFFDTRNPLNSGLVFSDGSAKAPRDLRDLPFLERGNFLVTARDLMRASLSADLVTLSACSSGLQMARNAGDEMEGFTRALLAAGSGSVMVAMWNVDQASSRGLLSSFYARLATAGDLTGKWKALQAAQTACIESEDEKLRHPYHWGAFVLIGDWR